MVNNERDRSEHLLHFNDGCPRDRVRAFGGAEQVARTESKRGRPDLQGSMELDAHLMATAAKLFIEQGYEGTSMGQIVAAAGAGKQSLYRRYANKETLFKAVFTDFVMKNILARYAEQLARFETDGASEAENGLERLHQIARQSFDFLLERESVETFRLFVAERSRFPDLKDHIRQMIGDLENEITRHIILAQKAGLIRTDIDQHAARSFMALLNEGPLVHALLEFPSVGTAAARDRYFDSAWKAFIDLTAVRP